VVVLEAAVPSSPLLEAAVPSSPLLEAAVPSSPLCRRWSLSSSCSRWSRWSALVGVVAVVVVVREAAVPQLAAVVVLVADRGGGAGHRVAELAELAAVLVVLVVVVAELAVTGVPGSSAVVMLVVRGLAAVARLDLDAVAGRRPRSARRARGLLANRSIPGGLPLEGGGGCGRAQLIAGFPGESLGAAVAVPALARGGAGRRGRGAGVDLVIAELAVVAVRRRWR
jgi:hypothetical protein